MAQLFLPLHSVNTGFYNCYRTHGNSSKISENETQIQDDDSEVFEETANDT